MDVVPECRCHKHQPDRCLRSSSSPRPRSLDPPMSLPRKGSKKAHEKFNISGEKMYNIKTHTQRTEQGARVLIKPLK